MSALQKLLFHIGVSDDASGKMLGIQRAVDKTCSTAKTSFGGLTSALGGALSAGALSGMIGPARAFNKSVNEVASLGTDTTALDALQKASKQFVISFGGNAAEVVSSAYDIQSAISGLQGTELASFTVASATLARGVKSDAATITDYVGTMYGVWQAHADKMGKSQWVEQLAGRTALAVQMFKTNGGKWAESVSALGASATAKGISMEEQFSVLGNLQSTMGGGEAATKYNAFLTGALNAQEKLGIKFFKNGKMLGMADILDKIKTKFGGKWDDKAMKAVKDAFGSDEAVKLIELLMGKTGKLRQDMSDLGQVNNMDKAQEMARTMSGVWGRLSGSWQAVRISFGQRLLPTINIVVGKLADFVAYIHKCIEIAPGLTTKIGLLAVGLTVVGAVLGLVGAAFVFGKMVLMGFLGPVLPLIGLLGKLKPLLTYIKMAVWVLAFVGKYLVMVFYAMTASALKFAAALLANPITWVVLGIMALVGAVVALVYYWSDLVAWFSNTSWGQGLITMFQDLRQWWNDLTASFTDGTWIQTLMGLLDTLMAPLRSLGDGIGWIGEKLGIISGEGPKIEASGVGALAAPRQSQILPGGVAGQISNATNNSGKTVTIGSITIQPQTMPSLDDFDGLGYLG
ncbi:phage tail tape measure protein [Desulfovibrio sp. QI0430]